MTLGNLTVRYGLLGGLAAIIITYILYLMGPENIVALRIYSAVAVIFVMGIVAFLHRKQMQNGILRFGDCMGTGISVFIIGILIWTAFMMLLVTIIAPEIMEYSKNARLAELKHDLAEGVLPERIYKEQADVIRNAGKETFLMGSFLTALLFTIFALILYLPLGAFFRSDAERR